MAKGPNSESLTVEDLVRVIRDNEDEFDNSVPSEITNKFVVAISDVRAFFSNRDITGSDEELTGACLEALSEESREYDDEVDRTTGAGMVRDEETCTFTVTISHAPKTKTGEQARQDPAHSESENME